MTSTIDDLFLPGPEPREVRYTVISMDDHLVEPPQRVLPDSRLISSNEQERSNV
jgi:hypothetical protein